MIAEIICYSRSSFPIPYCHVVATPDHRISWAALTTGFGAAIRQFLLLTRRPCRVGRALTAAVLAAEDDDWYVEIATEETVFDRTQLGDESAARARCASTARMIGVGDSIGLQDWVVRHADRMAGRFEQWCRRTFGKQSCPIATLNRHDRAFADKTCPVIGHGAQFTTSSRPRRPVTESCRDSPQK
ncbi:hypothetical protein ACWEP5_23330 [Nocardia niigatensis]